MMTLGQRRTHLDNFSNIYKFLSGLNRNKAGTKLTLCYLINQQTEN